MRQFEGIGGLLTTIKDTNLRQALQRLGDNAQETGAAVTLLSKNKTADTAQVVVARPNVPRSDYEVTGTEIVNAFTANVPDAVGSITDIFSTKPTPGNFVAYVFVKELANGGAPPGTAFVMTLEYGYGGATENVDLINDNLSTGAILTAVRPFYSDGSTPISYGVSTTAGLEYDLQLNIVAV